jgi:hypothetical protein
MTPIRILLAATAMMGMSSLGAQAEEPFHVTGQGENFAVEYAPGYTGNIVGGGTSPRTSSGDAGQAEYAIPTNGIAAPGIPTFRGGREGDVVYIPAPTRSLHAGTSNQG